ncbi:MAG: HAMP domain-containing histidine kinase [Cyanobacteria bacterium RM1_2_2]|nr:HAMP domain-containing histidine kinase [Cyanobacteria bacterium RM1_2_2]
MPNIEKSNGIARLHQQQSWWHRIFRETRTQLLLLYALLMMIVTAASVPIFMLLVFADVDRRAQRGLEPPLEQFRRGYAAWQNDASSNHNFQQFVTQILTDIQPEDDNFLIIYLNGQYYKSNPRELPSVIGVGSEIEQQWLSFTEPRQGKVTTDNPQIGNVLYLTQPLELNGERRGLLVVAHITFGEHQEALDSAQVFAKVTIGVFLIAFILCWFATGKLLAPVRKLAVTARSISELDLTKRLPVQGSGELAELAETFNDMMNRLQGAFTSQRNFINDAGHELRTPITIIQGHLELLEDVPPEITETLEIVTDELNRMNRLVNDMLLLAKVEQPDFLQLETIEVSAFIAELYTKVQTLADRNWQVHCPEQGKLVGDPQRLTGAMVNLIQNAVRYTKPGDLIEMGTMINRKSVRFWVRDTGEGIALSDQARIFERFARVASSYRHSEGTGLGLNIVRAVAEAHGGRVKLTSQLGNGSTFTLILPLEPPKERLLHDSDSDHRR